MTAINVLILAAIIIITPTRIGLWFNSLALSVKDMGWKGVVLCNVFASEFQSSSGCQSEKLTCLSIELTSPALWLHAHPYSYWIRLWHMAWIPYCRYRLNVGSRYCVLVRSRTLILLSPPGQLLMLF